MNRLLQCLSIRLAEETTERDELPKTDSDPALPPSHSNRAFVRYNRKEATAKTFAATVPQDTLRGPLSLSRPVRDSFHTFTTIQIQVPVFAT